MLSAISIRRQWRHKRPILFILQKKKTAIRPIMNFFNKLLRLTLQIVKLQGKNIMEMQIQYEELCQKRGCIGELWKMDITKLGKIKLYSILIMTHPFKENEKGFGKN